MGLEEELIAKEFNDIVTTSIKLVNIEIFKSYGHEPRACEARDISMP